MNTQNLALGLVVVLAFVGSYVGAKRPAVVSTVVEKTFGAAGPDYYTMQNFVNGFTVGGNGCTATSTIGSVGTLQGAGDTSLNREDVTCINYTVNQADVTLTLAASTTGWYPRAVGASKTLLIRNASTTATADIIFAAGTGIDLKGVATTSSVTNKTLLGDTDAANTALITFVRQPDRDVAAYLTLFQD